MKIRSPYHHRADHAEHAATARASLEMMRRHMQERREREAPLIAAQKKEKDEQEKRLEESKRQSAEKLREFLQNPPLYCPAGQSSGARAARRLTKKADLPSRIRCIDCDRPCSDDDAMRAEFVSQLTGAVAAIARLQAAAKKLGLVDE